jgi:hypothetical protein
MFFIFSNLRLFIHIGYCFIYFARSFVFLVVTADSNPNTGYAPGESAKGYKGVFTE